MLGYLIDLVCNNSPMVALVCTSAALVIGGGTLLFAMMEG